MTGSLQDAAARLAAAGVSWQQHTWREQKQERFVDPRKPVAWVEHRGLMVSFTGEPESLEFGEGSHTVRTLLTQPMLRRVVALLETLPMLTDSVVPFTPYEDPNAMNLFGARGLGLAIDGMRWSRVMLGNYRLPFTADLVRDLRVCLEAEIAVLALAGDTTD